MNDHLQEEIKTICFHVKTPFARMVGIDYLALFSNYFSFIVTVPAF